MEAIAAITPMTSDRCCMVWATGGAIRSDLFIFTVAAVI